MGCGGSSFPSQVPENVKNLGSNSSKPVNFNIAYGVEKGSEEMYSFAKICINSLYTKASVNPQRIQNKTGYFEVKFVDEYGSEILVFSKHNGDGDFSASKACSIMEKIKKTVK